MQCKRCGAQLNEDERFCYQCGAAVTEQDSVKKQKRVWPFVLAAAALILLAAVILIVLFASGSKEKQYEEQLQLAERYLDELDYDRAILAYKEAIKIDPERADAYLDLCDVYLAQGDREAAIEVLEDGIRKCKDDEKRRLEKKLKKLKEEEKQEEEEQGEEETVSEEEIVEEEAVDVHAMYEAFLNNEERVLNVNKADRYDHWFVPFPGILEKGNSYTLKEIRDSIAAYSGVTRVGEPAASYIDCGLDGKEELLIGVDYDWYDTGDQGHLDIVIIEENGHLELCYDFESRMGASTGAKTAISYSGYIVRKSDLSGLNEAISVGVIDSRGEYRDWYVVSRTWDAAYGYDYPQKIYDLLAGKHACIAKYGIENKEDMICPQICIDYQAGQYEEADAETRKAFEDAGIQISTMAEVEKALEERRIEIGLSREVIEYDAGPKAY